MAKKKYATDDLLGPAPKPEGLLTKAKSVGLSGLATIGNVFGTPGSMVRNALAGENPLTPLMHPLSGEGRVEGRDLLRRNGLIGKKDTWGNFAGGLAVDIATDPLTYLTGPMGALTKSGKVGRAAGFLDDAAHVATSAGRKAGTYGFGQTAGKYASRARTTLGDLVNYGDEASIAGRHAKAATAAQKMGLNLDDLMKEPLGGVANVWLPGFGTHTLGAGSGGADFLEGVGKAVNAIPGAKTVGNALGAANLVKKGLFHAASGGFFDKYGQDISELAYEKMPVAKKQMVKQVLSLRDRFDAISQDFKKAFKPEAAQSSFGPGWREVGKDEILQPGNKMKMDVSSGKSYVFDKNYVPPVPSVHPSGFGEGDLVQATDRGNYGYIKSLGDDKHTVHFTHPTTGATAEVEIPHANLKKTDSTKLPPGLQKLHDPTARVLDRIIKMTAETKGDIEAAVQKFAAGAELHPQLKDDIAKLADDYVQAKDSIWQQNLEMGGKGRVLDDMEDFQHLPRYRSERGSTEKLDKWRVLPMGHPSALGREGPLRYLRQDQIEDIRKGIIKGELDANGIVQKYGDILGYPGEKGLIGPPEHADELVEMFKDVPEAAAGKRLFDNLSIEDLGKYLLSAHKRNASLQAIHEAFNTNLSEGGIPLRKAFEAVGMDPDKAIEHFSKIAGHKKGLLNTVATVPPELVKAAQSVFKVYEQPEWANAVTKTLDWANKWFKPSVTMVKPAFWFRNHTSGQYANMVSGYIENPGDIGQYMDAYKQAMNLWKTQDQGFMREMQVEGILGLDSTWDATKEGLVGAGMPGHSPYPDNPLKFGQTYNEVGMKMAEQPSPTNPALAWLGKMTEKPRQAGAAYMASNSKANRAVEYANRAAMYLYLKNKGFDPEKAAQIVTSIHYDYGGAALSPFENSVMKRVVPFYVFSRNNLPWTIERLLEKPGGGLSQTMQALSRAHNDEDLSPEYISETASVPMGGLPDGSQRFLTGVGLGFEDPAQFAVPSIKSAGLEAVSRANPLIRAPLEYLFGQSTFQKGPRGGRELEDLDPLLGRTLANIGNITGMRASKSPVKYPGSGLLEHVLSNSPAGGVGTAIRTLTDPRKGAVSKGVNLGTGFRLTDVSPASQDQELRRRIQQVERSLGARQYTDVYMPADIKAGMSPAERKAADQLSALRKLLEARSKSRRETKK